MNRKVCAWIVLCCCMFVTQSFAKDVELKAGDAAPDLLGKDVEGKEVRLAEYAGKVVVVSFFATWCGPCQKELPMLESLQRAGANKGLQVIAVDWQEEGRVFRQLVKKNPEYQIKFVSDHRGSSGRSYGVRAIPHMFLIDKNGRIAFVNVGYGESVIDALVPEVNRALLANVTTSQ